MNEGKRDRKQELTGKRERLSSNIYPRDNPVTTVSAKAGNKGDGGSVGTGAGSLPCTYFEVFEWTEARALPPKYKLSGPNHQLLPKRYIPQFSFHGWPSTLPSPGNSRLHASLNFPHPFAYTRIHVRFSHFSASTSPLAGHSASRQGRLPQTPLPEKYLVPLRRLLLPRPSPLSPPDPGLTGSPDHEVRGSLPSAPSK